MAARRATPSLETAAGHARDYAAVALAYLQNRGLDINRNGAVTRGEVIAKVKAQLAAGLLPENAA